MNNPEPADPRSVGPATEGPLIGDRIHQLARPFDESIDQILDRVRGHAITDLAFYKLSELGDYSLIWHLLGAAKALNADDPSAALLRSTTLLGGESLLVNQGIKRLFRRTRPIHDYQHPHRLRRPLTSSFPSGHASSALLAAAILADRSRLAPVYYGLAVAVASSRVYVRAHHASDVAVGAVIGIALGQLARRAWPARRSAKSRRTP